MMGGGINPETDSFESENYSLPPSDENIYAMPPIINRTAPPIPSNPPVTHPKIPASDSFDAFFDSRAGQPTTQKPAQNLSRVSSFSSTNSGGADKNIGASIFGGAGQMGSNTRSTLPMGQQQPTYQMPPGANMGSQPLYPRLPIQQQPQRPMQPMGMQPMRPMGQQHMVQQPMGQQQMGQMQMNPPMGMNSLGAPRGQIVINSAAQLPSPMQPTKTATYVQKPKVQNPNLSDFDPFA